MGIWWVYAPRQLLSYMDVMNAENAGAFFCPALPRAPSVGALLPLYPYKLSAIIPFALKISAFRYGGVGAFGRFLLLQNRPNAIHGACKGFDSGMLS